MTRGYKWLLALVPLVLCAELYGADAESKSGIIKGTITVAGRPTTEAVVSVEGIAPEVIKARVAAPKSKKAVMNQREMKFVPRVLPVLVGTTVDFPNNDTTWHNVFSKSEAKDFDLGLYPPGNTRSTTLDKPGEVRVLCNVHPVMEGFIVVKEHPYFSGTDQRGNYRINNVPLGKYRVQVWHPQLGTRESAVQLGRDGQVLEINFDLKK
jgi:plastocyanin